jgi:hypothetical protein
MNLHMGPFFWGGGIEGVPPVVEAQYRDNLKWIREAGQHHLVVGSQARILYSDRVGRTRLALAFNSAVMDGTLQVMVQDFFFLEVGSAGEEVPCSYGTPRTILCQLNQVHTLTSYFCKIHSHGGDTASIPVHVMWGLWRTKLHGGACSLSTPVSSARNSTNSFSVINHYIVTAIISVLTASLNNQTSENNLVTV